MKTFTIVTLAVTVGIILAASIGVALGLYALRQYEPVTPAHVALVRACAERIAPEIIADTTLPSDLRLVTASMLEGKGSAWVGSDGIWRVTISGHGRAVCTFDAAGNMKVTR